MKTIILTSKSAEADKLRQRLAELDTALKDIPCFAKDGLSDNMDCEVIFSTWYMPQFSPEEVKRIFPKLKAIFYAAGTVRHFAQPFFDCGIRIFSAAEANGVPVAEFTAAQIILANKGYFQSQRRFKWSIWKHGFYKARHIAEVHSGNYGAAVGILGCGAVGSTVVRFLKPFQISVKVYDPYMSETRADELGVELTTLEDIFSTCNVVSNHMPDIPETRGIINGTLLLSMLPSATLINTGRGGQINEADLAKVLKKRKDICALLDVTRHEPPLPWSALYRRKNIFITPHIAGSLSNEINRMIDYSYESYQAFVNGNQPEGEVKPKDMNHKA